jgi:hypothetical protein
MSASNSETPGLSFPEQPLDNALNRLSVILAISQEGNLEPQMNADYKNIYLRSSAVPSFGFRARWMG